MTPLEHHCDHFQTLNSIREPRIARVISRLMVLGMILVIAFVTLVPWIQTTSGNGRVTALNPIDRQQEINALVSGRIEEWYVHDGDHVNVGDPIVKIVDNDPQLLERLNSERAEINAKLGAAEQALKTANIDLRRMRELFEQGLAARREYEQAQIAVAEKTANVATVRAELQRTQINVSRQSVQTVTAPRDGVILRVNAGDAATFVSAGAVVATFVPDNIQRAVELYIDGRDVAIVRQGAKVRLQFEGWPAVQFSGWPSRAIGMFGGVVTAVDASAHSSGLFRILVTEDPEDPNPWPDQSYVRFGSKARGWILLSEVTVGYEIWRQLNNFPPNFPIPSGQ
ncbi:MAG: HlyD family efflux transporter periplasmic adaptor subunit [Pseudomonadota bacterium]